MALSPYNTPRWIGRESFLFMFLRASECAQKHGFFQKHPGNIRLPPPFTVAPNPQIITFYVSENLLSSSSL